MEPVKPREFMEEVERTLHDNILRFWLDRAVDPAGGFYGRIDGDGVLHADAPRGAILNARILWAFSAAYRHSRRKEYLEAAARAARYLIDRFYDREFGGVYWSVSADGEPADTKKQIYAIGFAIYGLSEYVRATGDGEALDYAVRLYRSIEAHSFDCRLNGYCEAFTREWGEIADMRLSEKDANEKKTMNTHLHILEPYTNLYRVWRDEGLRGRIENLLEVFLDRIYDPATGHLGLFFDEQWRSRDAGCSYGHDIEASWLLLEAAMECGSERLMPRVMKAAAHIARASMEGLRPDGSMIYERHADGRLDTERHWWVQAEAVVGLLWLWHYHGDSGAYGQAAAVWRYIGREIVDRDGGEWWWGAFEDGSKDRANDKAGFWKCPYHNTRMCIEAAEILGKHI